MKTITPTPLASNCLYCGRVQWGEIQYLGSGHWRHNECNPGSISWCEWYEQQPKGKRTSAMQILYKYKKGLE